MKNHMKKAISLLLAVLMMASMSINAFAAESLEAFTSDEMSDTKDFTYTVTHETGYVELSAVKLEWSVPVVKYTKTDVRTWNPETLHWGQNYESSGEADVSFTLTNRGTYAIKANVSFTPAVEGSASVSFGKKDPEDAAKTVNNNDPTIPSIVGDAHALKVAKGEMTDAEYLAARDKYVIDNCKATIAGTVKVDDVSKLTADSGKLGTYTVKISDPSKIYKITYSEYNQNSYVLNKEALPKSIKAGEELTFTVNFGDYEYVDAKFYVNGSKLDYLSYDKSSGVTNWGDKNGNASYSFDGTNKTGSITISGITGDLEIYFEET